MAIKVPRYYASGSDELMRCAGCASTYVTADACGSCGGRDPILPAIGIRMRDGVPEHWAPPGPSREEVEAALAGAEELREQFSDPEHGHMLAKIDDIIATAGEVLKMTSLDNRSTIKLRAVVAVRLAGFAASQRVSRSRSVELLLDHFELQPPPAVDMSRDHALELLAQSAELGSVPARIAFERALRSTTAPPAELDPLDELAARRTS